MVSVITNQKKLLIFFNNHFASVGREYAKAIKASKKNIRDYITKIGRNSRSLYFSPITIKEVIDLIVKLPNKKSSGFDQIDNILLKELKMELASPLCVLFNRSLAEGIFPNSMKIAEVVPLYKSKE